MQGVANNTDWSPLPDLVDCLSASASEVLGRRIRNRRCELRITQSRLCRMTGCCQSAICDCENGLRGVRVTMLLKIAKALETTASELLEGIE